jgi:hypothetical protein
MKGFGREGTFLVFSDCKVQNIERKTGSYVLRVTFKAKGQQPYTIFCSKQFEDKLRSIKELNHSCRLVFRQYKSHPPYLISLEAPDENT